jgi:2-keto-4-pentenoate hydratase
VTPASIYDRAVDDIDPRLRAALRLQLDGWRAMLAAGAERVGWKLGVGERERIGAGPVLGHLTSATRLKDGAALRAGNAGELHADAELAIHLGRDVEARADRVAVLDAIDGFGAALEIVDLAVPDEDPQAIVAANVFHRAFALGGLEGSLPAGEVEGRLLVDGEVRARGEVVRDVVEAVCAAATVLAATGERLQAGDHLITGAIVQIPVRPGDQVTADLGPLGRVGLRIAD